MYRRRESRKARARAFIKKFFLRLLVLPSQIHPIQMAPCAHSSKRNGVASVANEVEQARLETLLLEIAYASPFGGGGGESSSVFLGGKKTPKKDAKKFDLQSLRRDRGKSHSRGKEEKKTKKIVVDFGKRRRESSIVIRKYFG